MPDWTAFVRARLRLIGVRPPSEHDVIDDLAGQLEEAYREALARGLPPADAEAAAAAHISDWEGLARQVGEAPQFAASRIERLEARAGDAAARGNRRARLLTGLLHDLRFAVRMARKAPVFTAVAVLTLALGIGANATIFSWINVVLLEPLPGADNRGLVDVWTQTKNSDYTAMSYPDFGDLRDALPSRLGLVVHDSISASLAGTTGAERIWIELVSDNFFDVLGVTPIAGRGFQPAEGQARTPVVVISERLARRRFGAAGHAAGQTVVINRTPFTVVGVAPAAFASGFTGLAMDVWLPIQMSEVVVPGASRVEARNNHWLNTIGRLAPGVTSDRAAAELTDLMNRIGRAHGDTQDLRMAVVPLWRSSRGAQAVLGPVLLVLMGLVAVVLLIACANLANLLLSRASARRREFALRLSLGCSRQRLIRQLLTEALLLVAAAAVAAAVAQTWTGGILTWFVPPSDLPIVLVSRADPTVMLFIAGAALVSVLAFGLVPALHAGRTDLVDALKRGDPSAGRGRFRLRDALVVSQVAFSLLLLASAGLFVRSLDRASRFDPGFRTDHVLLGAVDLFSAGYDRTRGTALLPRILDELRALPGVESASLARRVPLGISTGNSSSSIDPEGYVSPKDDPAWSYFNWIGADYFRTMGIPVVAGREFAVSDRPDQPEVFVVNQSFVDRYWPGQNPIGKRVRYGKDWYPVAGVVANSKYRRLNEPASPFVYFSTTWNYRSDVVFHLRTRTDPMSLADALRETVRRADPALPVSGVITLDDHVRAASFQQRLAAWLLSAFGMLALLLASLGLYATMAYAVSQRTRELGARLALGATGRDIVRLVLAHAARVMAVGLVIGLALTAAVAPVFASLLVGVRPLDPSTLAIVTTILAAVALVASYVPARRAARLDPLQALRVD